jgi:hypothetical protein
MKHLYQKFKHFLEKPISPEQNGLNYEELKIYFSLHGMLLDDEFADFYMSINGVDFLMDQEIYLKLPFSADGQIESSKMRFFYPIHLGDGRPLGYINPVFYPGDGQMGSERASIGKCSQYLVFGAVGNPSYLLIGKIANNLGKIYHWTSDGEEEHKPYFAYNSLSEMLSAVYED